ncbi:MAG: ATP-binding cassette domain-containing protein [Sphaerochaeta sp.]|nr:ATP-binding cassette domain-containing protein [Sphaerochaeta sp.]
MDETRKVVLSAQAIRTYFPIKNAFGRVLNQVKAVDGVTMRLYQGETYGLVGETGCGKSTFGRTVIRLVKPTDGRLYIGDQEITDWDEKALRPLRRNMQMVFQDPYMSLDPRQKISDCLIEVLDIHHLGHSHQEKADMAMSILEKVGLRAEHFYRYPYEFSGGQRQRIGLARALILNPQLIVCDEPVSALDVSIQSQIINLLLDLQEKDHLTYLFIAHDISVVKYISNRIGVMYLGHLVEEGLTDSLFDHPMHPYTQALLSAVPEPNPHEKRQRVILQGDPPSPMNPPTGCVFHPRVFQGDAGLLPVRTPAAQGSRRSGATRWRATCTMIRSSS